MANVVTYLTAEVPLRADGIVDGLRLEFLCTQMNDTIWIWFSCTQDANIFLHKVVGFNHMNPDHTL